MTQINLSGVGMMSQRTRDRLVETLGKMGIRSKQVLEAIKTTPRHLFIDEALASRAYENTSLPIGYNQTISQPYIVAKMIESVLGERQLDSVLEIGTGSGYQSVMLAQFAKKVYTLERIQPLLSKAKRRFFTLRYNNIYAMHSDGLQGCFKHAPYDAIVVSAAPVSIPDVLREQLAVGGRLIAPVGASGDQRLLLVVHTATGFDEHRLDRVRFVPMLAGLNY